MLVRSTRLFLIIVPAAAGIALLIFGTAGGISTAFGVSLIGIAAIVWMWNWLVRISFDWEDRDKEERERESRAPDGAGETASAVEPPAAAPPAPKPLLPPAEPGPHEHVSRPQRMGSEMSREHTRTLRPPRRRPS